MRNISFGQILVLVLVCFLLFGDFMVVKKKIKSFIKNSLNFFFEKDKKKGN